MLFHQTALLMDVKPMKNTKVSMVNLYLTMFIPQSHHDERIYFLHLMAIIRI